MESSGDQTDTINDGWKKAYFTRSTTIDPVKIREPCRHANAPKHGLYADYGTFTRTVGGPGAPYEREGWKLFMCPEGGDQTEEEEGSEEEESEEEEEMQEVGRLLGLVIASSDTDETRTRCRSFVSQFLLRPLCDKFCGQGRGKSLEAIARRWNSAWMFISEEGDEKSTRVEYSPDE